MIIVKFESESAAETFLGNNVELTIIGCSTV